MAQIHIAALLTVVAISSCSIVKSPTSSDGTFELLILHNNDMHARFEQTSQMSGTCTAADRDAGKCYGGFPRVAHVVKEARKAAASGEGPPVLYLNAGDTYTGTAWFTLYKWKIAAEFVNALQPDAVSLGNHELDDAVDGLVPFIRNLTAPVLAANLILDNVPELQDEPNFHKSVILTIDDVKIGVIGYLTPETKFLAPRNKVEYEDEIVALRREVQNLKKEGVTIFIALGHSGYIKDLEIGKEVEDIDLVIGGHSNTFLWNSNTTEEIPEHPQGPYPMIVTQASGREVPIVQAYAYTKYMGRLHLTFNSNGELIEYDGTPLLLNQDVPRDPDLIKVVNKYRQRINVIMSEVVGSTMVALDGESCRLYECNIGNLINDAMLYYTKQYYNVDHGDVNIAITQGGRIRASIIKNEIVPYNLTREDWLLVLPFSDTLTVITLNGTILMEALEHSVDTWRTVDSTGQFLQMAGMRVVYDLARPAGSRIVKAEAVCSSCDNPELADIQDDHEYKIITSTFIADSGDGYIMFEGLTKETLPYNEITSILSYLKVYSPVSPNVSNRIDLLNSEVLRRITEAEFTSVPQVKQIRYSTNRGSSNSYHQIYQLMFMSCLCLLRLENIFFR